MGSNIFDGMSFTLFLGSLSLKQKSDFSNIIKDNGGQIITRVSSSSCIICSQDEYTKGGNKIREAEDLMIPIVMMDYIIDAVEEKRPLDRLTLIMDGKLKGANQTILKHIERMEQMFFGTVDKVKENLSMIAISNFPEQQMENFRAQEGHYLPHLTHRFFYNIQNNKTKKVEEVSLDILREHKRRDLNKKLEEERKLKEQSELFFFKEKQEKRERAERAKVSYEETLLKRAKNNDEKKMMILAKKTSRRRCRKRQTSYPFISNSSQS
jgi:hypothetical protein